MGEPIGPSEIPQLFPNPKAIVDVIDLVLPTPVASAHVVQVYSSSEGNDTPAFSRALRVEPTQSIRVRSVHKMQRGMVGKEYVSMIFELEL